MTIMVDNTRLTDYIRTELKKRRLSQRAAAEAAGIHHTTLTSIYQNRTTPSPETLRLLAEANVGLSYTRMMTLAGHITEDEANNRDAFSEQVLALSEQLTPEQKETFLQWLRAMLRE